MKWHWFFFKRLHIYITTCRMKARQSRDNGGKEATREWFYDIIEPLRQRSKGTCELCGKPHKRLYAHHVLPFSHFPEYYKDLDNMLYICNSCHNMIHTDPFVECSMIEDMAIKKGIKLQNHYRICGRVLR